MTTASKPSPAFRFYAKDWLTSERVRLMGAEARGYYMDLLSHAWLQQGLPVALRDIAALLGVAPRKMTRLWSSIGPLWVERAGRLINERQELERDKERAYRDRQRGAAGKRWHTRGSPTETPTGVPRDKPWESLSVPVPVPNGGVPPLSASARSNRPVFSGQRLVVFEWMYDDARRMLGPLTGNFHLDKWFYALDAELVTTQVVIPKRDGGRWFSEQLLAEVQRRGLPLSGAGDAPTNVAHAWLCKTCGDVHEGTATQEAGRTCLAVKT